MAALYGRDTRDGGGEIIDAPLYGSVLRVLEWTLAGYDRLGIVRQREGNRLSHSAPLDNYPTADGSFVCIVAGSDANFRRLCAAMERPDLATDPRFASLAERASRGDEINGLVRDWTSALTAGEITERCVAHDVPVGTAYSAADIFADPHMAARGDLVPVEDPVIGTVRQQAPYPRLARHPAPVPTGAPRLGEHNREVWCGLVGLSEAELDDLVARAASCDDAAPKRGRVLPQLRLTSLSRARRSTGALTAAQPRGRPSTRSATMLRWISDVPPAIVPANERRYWTAHEPSQKLFMAFI